MGSEKKKIPDGLLIQRDSAGHYLLLTLLSFAASVTLVRFFLSLTNYPQVGNGTLHIAHVLWGGLLLYIAALLPLLFVNRGIYRIAAILAGSGVGLFIDEVGKFITQQNDYFFPIAASIIYAFFLLTLLLLVNIRRKERLSVRDELIRSLELVEESLQKPLTPVQIAELNTFIENAGKQSDYPYKDLALDLWVFANFKDHMSTSTVDSADNQPGKFQRWISTYLTNENLRPLLIGGLVFIAFLTLKNPFSVLLAPWLPTGMTAFLQNLYIGRHLDVVTDPFWISLRLILEVTVGFALLTAAMLFLIKRNRQGALVGYISLLVSLTTVNLLLFYFEQFSTIITTGLQFLLLLGIIQYRKYSVTPPTDPSSPPG